MDVKYRPEPWQNMGDGMNRITKDALIKLQYANESLKKIDGRIRDLDTDGSIHFNPKDQSRKIGELLESYSSLQKYCGEAGRVVSEHIDKPFLVEMDKFAQKMRDISISSFKTENRIGSTITKALPDSHTGYGSVPQTIKTKKDKITVEDIFKDSPAFDNVLRAEYKELKKQNPDAKLNYKEYKKAVPSTRGFEYKSIEDEQKKLETVRDLAIGGGIIIATILCPPLGTAAAVVYGAVQIKSGIDGEDWGTHRKLSQEERAGNIIFGGLDAIPVVGFVGKGAKAFKSTNELADLAKLLKFKEGMPGFNPNLGKNVVQSLKENNLLKNLKIQGWKTVDKVNDADYFIKGLVAKGVDSVSPYFKGVEILPDGSVVRTGTNYSGKFQEAHDASKASIQSRISNLESGGVNGSGSGVKSVSGSGDKILNNGKSLDEMARVYVDVVKTNKKWSWLRHIPGGKSLSKDERMALKEYAIKMGWLEEVPIKIVTDSNNQVLRYADFEAAGLVEKRVELPKELWKAKDVKQFKWLDNFIGGRPEGTTWHHNEKEGIMELVGFGIHNITNHNGGRTRGHWAFRLKGR